MLRPNHRGDRITESYRLEKIPKVIESKQYKDMSPNFYVTSPVKTRAAGKALDG